MNGARGATALDRELTELLSIAPSPEFAARVRERIGDEPAPGRTRPTWWLGFAAAAALILAVVFASRAWRSEEAPRQARTASDRLLPPVAETPRVDASPRSAAPTKRAATPPRVVVARARATTRVPAEVEVLVSGDQLRAIARLQQLMVNGQLTEDNLPPAAAAGATDLRPAPLAIAPLTLPAVESVSGPDGSRPRSDR